MSRNDNLWEVLREMDKTQSVTSPTGSALQIEREARVAWIASFSDLPRCRETLVRIAALCLHTIEDIDNEQRG